MTTYEIGLGIPAEPLFRSVRVLLLITFLKASHSFRNRLLVICKNSYLFATMIMTSVSSPFKIGRAALRESVFIYAVCVSYEVRKYFDSIVRVSSRGCLLLD